MKTVLDKLDDVALVLGATLAIPLGTALFTLNEGTLDNPGPWFRSLLIGCGVAIGYRVYKWGKAKGGEIEPPR